MRDVHELTTAGGRLFVVRTQELELLPDIDPTRSMSEPDGTLVHIQKLEDRDVLWRNGEEMNPGEGFRFLSSELNGCAIVMGSSNEHVLYYKGKEQLRAERIETETSWGVLLIKCFDNETVRVGILLAHNTHLKQTLQMCEQDFTDVHQLTCQPDRSYRHGLALVTQLDGTRAIARRRSVGDWNVERCDTGVREVTPDGDFVVTVTDGRWSISHGMHQGDQPISHRREFPIMESCPWHLFVQGSENGPKQALLLNRFTRPGISVGQPFDELLDTSPGLNNRSQIVGALCLVRRGNRVELDFIGTDTSETTTLASAKNILVTTCRFRGSRGFLKVENGQTSQGKFEWVPERKGPLKLNWETARELETVDTVFETLCVRVGNGEGLLPSTEVYKALTKGETPKMIGPFDERQGGILRSGNTNNRPFTDLVIARSGEHWGLCATGGMLPATHRYERLFGAKFTHGGKVLVCHGVREGKLEKLQVCLVPF